MDREQPLSPVEQSWLTISLPDGMYIMPPYSVDQATHQGRPLSLTLLVNGVIIVLSLLVVIFAFAAIV